LKVVGKSGPKASIQSGEALGILPGLQEETKMMVRLDAASSSFCDVPGIRRGIDVPFGYRCRSNKDLLWAYDSLTAIGIARMLLKPSGGASSGDGIIMNVTRSQLEAYDFAEDDIVSLEEMINLATVDALVVSPVLHFIGPDQCGRPAEQLIRGDCIFDGNKSPPLDIRGYSDKMLSRCHEIAEQFAKATGLQGFWGLDFLVRADTMEPLLTDVNSGRPNGG